MKTKAYIILLPLCMLACKAGNKNTGLVEEERNLTKLEKLVLLPQDSVMLAYDLSNEDLDSFPDLSAYTIHSLDLSNNLLDTIITDYLPKQLEQLNLSHNQFKGLMRLEENSIPRLKELDLSYNDLKSANIWLPLYKIVLSYNDLTIACFNHKNLRYLDVSYNYHMPSEVCFEPTEIDTVIREGVAEGKRLVGPLSVRYYKPID